MLVDRGNFAKLLVNYAKSVKQYQRNLWSKSKYKDSETYKKHMDIAETKAEFLMFA